MPLISWDNFLDSHYRPNLFVGKFEEIASAPQKGTWLALLRGLIEALGTHGNCAMRRQGLLVLVAFELDTDAQRFTVAVRADAMTREAEWSAQALFQMNASLQRKIVARLKPEVTAPLGIDHSSPGNGRSKEFRCSRNTRKQI